MKLRTTLFLLLLACGLYGVIHFYFGGLQGTRANLESNRYITSFDRDDVDGIIINRGDEIKVRLAKKSGRWTVEEPLKDRADENLVAQILTALERIEKHQEISIPPKKVREIFSDFGLANPKMRIEFTGKNAPPAILIGREAAVDNRIYLAIDGDDTAYVADVAVRDAVNLKSDEFRDPQLTDLPATQVSRVLVRSPEGQIELVQDGGEWNLIRPLRARADTARLADLIRGATTVRVKQFVAKDNVDIATFGLSEPRGTVSLFTDDPEETVVFDIGSGIAEKSKGEDVQEQTDGVYVRFAKRKSVVLLPKEVENFLTTKPSDLRDKHLIRLNLDVVDRITLELAGTSPIVLGRDKEEWVLIAGPDKKPQPANASMVFDLLNQLRSTEAKKFVADAPSDLSKYGLKDPQLRITISSYASENVPEQGAGEHPLLHLAFGKSEDGIVYARLEEEPFIVAVDSTLMRDIILDPVLWRALPIFSYTLEDITKITREISGHSTVLTRTPAGGWTGDSGAVNQGEAGSLSNTLARLRAVRWLGEARAQYGLDKPVLKIEFKTSSASHVLKVGAEQAGMFCATTGNGVFLINRPDFDTLIGRLRLSDPVTEAVTSPASP